MNSIVIVLPELLPVPPVSGGAVEHWVHEVTSRMVHPGRHLAVISRPAGTAGFAGVQYIGVRWTALERWFAKIKDKTSWRNPLRYIAKTQNVWSYGRRAARAAREFDLVYLHNEPNVLLFLKRRAGQRIVLHMHNDHLSLPLFRPFYRRALAKADLVICVSDYIRQRALQHFPAFAHRFKVMLNGTNPGVFRPYGALARDELREVLSFDPACKYLLYVGRLVSIKGVHILLEAFREVHRQQPQARLILAGSSFFGGAHRTPYEDQLAKLAQPLRDAILFTGFLPHEKLKYLYSLADVVVVPSIWSDPCPLVVLEAMAAGACVVASSVGGVPELLAEEGTGVLVPPQDAGALSRELLALLGDPQRRHSIGQAARAKVVADHTWEQLVERLENLFGELR